MSSSETFHSHAVTIEAVSIGQREVWLRGTTVVLLIASLASGGLSYQGLRLATKAPIAALLAVISVLLAFTCWSFLQRRYAKSSPPVRDHLLLTIALPTTVLVVLTSTITGFAGLATPSAMRASLTRQVDEAERRLQAAEERAQDESALLPVLAAEADAFEAAANDEATTGRFFRKGKGGIYSSLLALSRAFEAAGQTLEQSQEGRDETARRAGKTVTAMRKILDQAEPGNTGMRDASRLIAAHLQSYNRALSDIERSVIPQVLVQLEIAVEQQGQATLTSAKKKQRAGEKAARQAITGMARQSVNKVSQVLTEAQNIDARSTSLRVKLPAEALVEELAVVAPLLGYVLAIDLFLPLVVLFMMTHLQTHLARRREPPISEETQTHGPSPAPADDGVDRLADIADRLRQHRHRTNA